MNSEPAHKSVPSIEDLAKFYTNSAFNFGAADIFCCGPFDTVERVSDLLFILSMIKDENERTPISQFTVVLSQNSDLSEADVRAGFNAAVTRHRGRPLDEKELEISTRRLKVVHAPDLQMDSAITLVGSAKRHSVVIFCDAAKYRDVALTVSRPASGAIKLEEDTSIAHVHRLAERAVAAAKQAECYVALDVGQFRPYRKENLDKLMSIDDCGVLGTEMSNHPDSFVAALGDEWFANLKAGRVGSVLAAIDALPDSMNRHKALLKLQMLHRAGLFAQAIELVRTELAAKRKIDPESLVKFVVIAVEAGEPALASELLTPAIAGLDR